MHSSNATALALCGALLFCASALNAAAQDVLTAVPGLSVEAVFQDEPGARQDVLPRGVPVRLSLRYRDPATGQPARNIKPMAWLRKVRPGVAACTEAVRAFRATSRLSADDVPLVGTVIAAVDSAGRIALTEPDVHLSNANLLGLVATDDPQAIVLPRPERADFLVARPGHGDIVRLAAPAFRQQSFARDLGRPSDLVESAGGRLWVLDSANGEVKLLAPTGSVLATFDLPSRPVALVPAGPRMLLIVQADGGASIVDRGTGEPTGQARPATIGSAFAATRDLILTRHETDGLIAHPLDNPQRRMDWPLGFAVAGLATDPQGRRAIVWSASGKIAIVDLAFGRKLAEFEGHGTISAAHIGSDAAFVGWGDRATVSVIALAQLQSGDAAIRDVRLQVQPSDPGQYKAAGITLLVPMEPMPAVIAQVDGGRTLSTVMAGGGLAQAPGAVLRLKSDPPRSLSVLRRMPIEVSDGVFETSVQLDRPGRWELVTSTGLGGTTQCLHVQVDGEEPSLIPPSLSVQLEPAPRNGAPRAISISIADGVDPLPDQLQFVISSLHGNWGRVISARRDEHGRYRAMLSFPGKGHYPIIVDGRQDLEATVIEVE